MPRITKGMVEAALANLNCIGELAAESFNGPTACYKFHAHSANGNMETLVKAGVALPAWVLLNRRHLEAACGWRIPQ